MIPTVLKKAGYVTASVGKWGQMCLGPGQWGFDEYLVFPGSGRYWRKQTAYYTVNGKQQDLPARHYLPDIMHEFLVDFIARHKDQPFFIYYPMSHIHAPIVRTPDSKPGATKEQLYAANIEYMDKLVGKLIEELDRQHLREKTVVLFTGDNGTAQFGAELATVNGRQISGMKGTMLEGGSRVPLVVNWPGVTPAGRVNRDLTDFSDFFATVAELAGAKLPEGVVLDSHSFAPQIRGEKGSPREWVYVELRGKSYVRGPRFKLTNDGNLFDMAESPFKEIPVADDSADPEAAAARKKLQAVLDRHKAAPWIPPRQARKRPGSDRRRKPAGDIHIAGSSGKDLPENGRIRRRFQRRAGLRRVQRHQETRGPQPCVRSALWRERGPPECRAADDFALCPTARRRPSLRLGER